MNLSFILYGTVFFCYIFLLSFFLVKLESFTSFILRSYIIFNQAFDLYPSFLWPIFCSFFFLFFCCQLIHAFFLYLFFQSLFSLCYRYIMVGHLGEGTYSQVALCQVESSRDLVAVKVAPKGSEVAQNENNALNKVWVFFFSTTFLLFKLSYVGWTHFIFVFCVVIV